MDMFKTIFAMAGLSQREVATAAGLTPQGLQARMKSQRISFLFFVLNLANARLVLEFEGGKKLDLTQYAEGYPLQKRGEIEIEI